LAGGGEPDGERPLPAAGGGDPELLRLRLRFLDGLLSFPLVSCLGESSPPLLLDGDRWRFFLSFPLPSFFDPLFFFLSPSSLSLRALGDLDRLFPPLRLAGELDRLRLLLFSSRLAFFEEADFFLGAGLRDWLRLPLLREARLGERDLLWPRSRVSSTSLIFRPLMSLPWSLSMAFFRSEWLPKQTTPWLARVL